LFNLQDIEEAVCRDDTSGNLYLSGLHCGHFYVACRDGLPVYAQLCPGNTAFDELRQACYDLYQCRERMETFDLEIQTPSVFKLPSSGQSMWPAYTNAIQSPRGPRHVKFLEDGDFGRWMAMPRNTAPYRNRRNAQYGGLSSGDDGLQTRTSRQIKFYAIPDRELPPSDEAEFRRQIARQVKFRSVDDELQFGQELETNVVGKKHAPRQVKFRSLNSDLLYPTLS